jgi:hypothetical protein
MTRRQVLALKWSAVLGGAALSVVVPFLLLGLGVESEPALWILAPGMWLVDPMHNIIPFLAVMIVVDAAVYGAAAYASVSLLLRVLRVGQGQ